MDPRFEAIIKSLKFTIDNLNDRIAVIEENTCNHESRLEDLEKAVEKLEDEVDEY